jgi:sugar diacid utilization regulator
MGNQRAVAAQLHIHPQPVRYRLGRLRELFGPELDEPGPRRRLFLALAWEDDEQAPHQPA